MYRFALTAAALAATTALPVAAQTSQTPPTTPAPAATPPATGTTPTPSATATPAPTPGAPAATSASAPNPTVGGAPMDATKPIATNAAAAPNLSTLVAAVKAAGLGSTLAGPGPFTVFAPTNEAFARLAPGTVDKLLEPANKPSLVKVLTYHVVPGAVTLEQLRAQITAGGGKATLTSVEGQPLIAAVEGNAVSIADVSGNKAYIQTPDVRQSNGVVHVVNGVLVPKLG